MISGISGQFGRSIWDGRGIFVYLDDHFLNLWDLETFWCPLKIPTPNPVRVIIKRYLVDIVVPPHSSGGAFDCNIDGPTNPFISYGLLARKCMDVHIHRRVWICGDIQGNLWTSMKWISSQRIGFLSERCGYPSFVLLIFLRAAISCELRSHQRILSWGGLSWFSWVYHSG